MRMLDWEEIRLPAGKLPGVGAQQRYVRMFRSPVPEGWLVLVTYEWMQVVPSITFVPDPEHAWQDGALPDGPEHGFRKGSAR